MASTSRRLRLPVARALVVAWIATGCAGASTRRPEAAAPERADPAELEALYLARTDSARMRFSAADVEFVSGMIAHHAQAIEMAALAPDRAASTAVTTLSARIINAQRDEIAWMQLWLRDRDQAVPSAPSMSGHAGHLPGMLTPAQLAELANVWGFDFDRLFMTSMIQHHRGAIAMVQDLIATDGAIQDPATFKLASDIHVDQTTEIARMEQMLAGMPRGASR